MNILRSEPRIAQNPKFAIKLTKRDSRVDLWEIALGKLIGRHVAHCTPNINRDPPVSIVCANFFFKKNNNSALASSTHRDTRGLLFRFFLTYFVVPSQTLTHLATAKSVFRNAVRWH